MKDNVFYTRWLATQLYPIIILYAVDRVVRTVLHQSFPFIEYKPKIV